jgi:F420-0:gamma-glutamyl ligase
MPCFFAFCCLTPSAIGDRDRGLARELACVVIAAAPNIAAACVVVQGRRGGIPEAIPIALTRAERALLGN